MGQSLDEIVLWQHTGRWGLGKENTSPGEHLEASVFALLYWFHCFFCAKKGITYATCPHVCEVLSTHMGSGKHGSAFWNREPISVGHLLQWWWWWRTLLLPRHGYDIPHRMPHFYPHCLRVKEASLVNSLIRERAFKWEEEPIGPTWRQPMPGVSWKKQLCMNLAIATLQKLNWHLLLTISWSCFLLRELCKVSPITPFYQRGHAGLPGFRCHSMAHS